MNTNELNGPALDLAVAKYEKFDFLDAWPKQIGGDYVGFVLSEDGKIESWHFDSECSRAGAWRVVSTYSPSTDGDLGQKIIEREQINLTTIHDHREKWRAYMDNENAICAYGPTHLIAAMRCYVASRLNDNAKEVPR